MRGIKHKKAQKNGMALGGIGTGTVEIHSDGRLLDWQIFNRGQWASVDSVNKGCPDIIEPSDSILKFYIRTEGAHGDIKVRKLFHEPGAEDFRTMMYSWNKEMETICWKPDFPVCHMKYEDEGFPVQVKADYASPFVVHDSRVSGTPGFYITYTLENPGSEALQVSLMGKMKNPVARDMDQRQLINRISQKDDAAVLSMESMAKEKTSMNGSISLGVSGGEHSYITGEFADYMTNYVFGNALGVTEESCMFAFKNAGAFWDKGLETIPDISGLFENVESLTEKEMDEILLKALALPSVHEPYERIRKVDPKLLETSKGKAAFLSMMQNRFGNDMSAMEKMWGDGALCTKLILEPGEKKEITFTVSWNFPNHFGENGKYIGHQYENWFASSADTAFFLLNNRETILSKVKKFSETLTDSNLNESMKDNWMIHLNTLLKCSWWTKKGEFGIWEGYGSCGFHTTDITYQGSFGLLALFPDLQLRQMEMGAKFQREDGRVHHFFTPDFDSVDDGFDRVDMNPQFVLLVCRDFLWTGDREYLDRMWKHVVLAMEDTEKLDENKDGLPDTGTRSNTYDAWNFQGTPSYLSGLWLGALVAAIRLAQEKNEEGYEQRWRKLLHKGIESMDCKLWNGEYYSLWVDTDKRDECCMTDQLDGQWYIQLLGLGEITDRKKREKALQSILEQNYGKESGLINAGYPKGKAPTLFTYENVQAEANWSGIEFIFASMLMENSMYEQAIEISENVEERYRREGRIFNHEECGEYYYRPLASWTMLLSATGFKLDVPGKKLAFAPVSSCARAPWFTPSSYGMFEKTKDQVRISCLEGTIAVKELDLSEKVRGCQVNSCGRLTKPDCKAEAGKVIFNEELIIQKGGELLCDIFR